MAAAIYLLVMSLAVGERARAFKGVSPGLLPPLGIIFGLLVAFLAAQVWGDIDRANTAVNREASALRAVVLLSESFPGDAESRLRGLVRQHIQEAETEEWPAMAQRHVTLTMIPTSLAQALQTTLALTTQGAGQVAAQREIVAALENATRRTPSTHPGQPIGGQLGQVDGHDYPGDLHLGGDRHGPQ